MRPQDHEDIDFRSLRQAKDPPEAQVFLEPGNVLVPALSVAIGAVVASSIVVTVYNPIAKQGGACHFLRPRHFPKQQPTPIFGLPATLALLQEMSRDGTPPSSLFAGMYGGSCPDWATPTQQMLVRDNINIVREIMERKGVLLTDIDVGGNRGRKLWFITGTNEVIVAKTDFIRQSDWFPSIAK